MVEEMVVSCSQNNWKLKDGGKITVEMRVELRRHPFTSMAIEYIHKIFHNVLHYTL